MVKKISTGIIVGFVLAALVTSFFLFGPQSVVSDSDCGSFPISCESESQCLNEIKSGGTSQDLIDEYGVSFDCSSGECFVTYEKCEVLNQ